MKVLIVSDTHRHNENYFRALEREKKVDLVIHCGDVEGSEYTIEEGAGCKTLIVMGNNDFFSSLPREIEATIGRYHVLITHGHSYGVTMGNEVLVDEALQRGFDMVIYGHTHKPLVEIKKDITVVNPGSLAYPRQMGRKPSYVIMELDDSDKAELTVKYLDEI